MGMGASLVMVAAGAILAFAVHAFDEWLQYSHGRDYSARSRNYRSRAFRDLLVELGRLW